MNYSSIDNKKDTIYILGGYRTNSKKYLDKNIKLLNELVVINVSNDKIKIDLTKISDENFDQKGLD